MKWFKEISLLLLHSAFYGGMGFIVAIVIRDYIFEFSNVNGSSMDPTLRDDDIVFVWKPNNDYELFDVVTIKVTGKSLVKRIVANEGDVVEVKNGKLYVNDMYFKYPHTEELFEQDIPRQTVGEGRFFAIGDNFNNSTDSRHHYGTFFYSQITGKVNYVMYRDGIELIEVD